MRRREFLKTAATFTGAAVTTATLGGCASLLQRRETELPTKATLAATSEDFLPTQTPEPSPTTTQETVGVRPMNRVVLVKTEDRAEGVHRAMNLLEYNPFKDKSVFVKPNFNSADSPPGSTHNDILQALVQGLNDHSAGRVTVGDRSGMGNTQRVMEQKNIFQMGEEVGFETMVFDQLDRDGWVAFEPGGSHWSRGFSMPRPMLEADSIVQTCCLKTHRYGGHFTLSLKNSVGMAAKFVPGEGYNYMNELHGSAHQRRMIAELNAAYEPDLILLDGVDAFTHGGPATGTLVHPGIILAGVDRVAIDAVGVAILRYFGTTPEVANGPIFNLDQIARAVELNLGVTSAEEIEIITEDDESREFATQIQDVLLMQ